MYQYVLCAKRLIPWLVKKTTFFFIWIYGNINNLILLIVVFDLTKGYLFSINGLTLILKTVSVGLLRYVTDKNDNVSSKDLDINYHHYYISSFGLAAILVIMSVSAFITAVILHFVNLSLNKIWRKKISLQIPGNLFFSSFILRKIYPLKKKAYYQYHTY